MRLKSWWSFFLKRKTRNRSSLPLQPSYFVPTYYVDTYADVAAAGIDPWHHFYYHGRVEGRWPAPLKAVELEQQLWHPSTATQAEKELEALVKIADGIESSAAAWFLGRWYAIEQRWSRVVAYMQHYYSLEHPVPGHLAPAVLWLDALRHIDQTKGLQLLQQLQSKYPEQVDLALVAMNYDHLAKSTSQWWQPLNRYYQQQGLCSVSLDKTAGRTLYDCLNAENPEQNPLPSTFEPVLVSVIVPTYNAEQTIATALKGLTQQTWPYLDIVVVDDASTDQTVAIVQHWQCHDQRIRLLPQSSNQGAYITRNIGAKHSQGEFITVHDSDDWSHPEKIEQQLRPLLQQTHLKATLSHWVRTSEELEFGGWNAPTSWESLVHRNISSLLMRKEVLDELGYWDRVICSADTEYYYRIMAVYGAQALAEVHPGLPLAFGRVRTGSLTQRAETHIFSVRSGLRYDYQLAYEAWHTQCGGSKAQLYMPLQPAQRPFAVSPNMLPKQIVS